MILKRRIKPAPRLYMSFQPEGSHAPMSVRVPVIDDPATN